MARTLGVPFLMGVGGSIDVLAGVTRRAPSWMQRAGPRVAVPPAPGAAPARAALRDDEHALPVPRRQESSSRARRSLPAASARRRDEPRSGEPASSSLFRLLMRSAAAGTDGGRPRTSPTTRSTPRARWLCRTHDVTGRRGSSKGFSLLHGWLPAYPETTGYVIGTLLEHGERVGDDSFAARAREMGDWEIEVQNPDGGVMEGAVRTPPTSSVVFNTGMVIHGWLDLHARFRRGALPRGRRARGRFPRRARRPTGPGDDERSTRACRTRTTHASTGRSSGSRRRPGTSATGDAARAQPRLGALRPARERLVRPVHLQAGDAAVHARARVHDARAARERGAARRGRLLRRSACRPRTRSRTSSRQLGKLPATYDETWRPRARY